MVVTLLLSGVQLIILGVLGEYLGRLFLTITTKPQFVIRDITRNDLAAQRWKNDFSLSRFSYDGLRVNGEAYVVWEQDVEGYISGDLRSKELWPKMGAAVMNNQRRV